MCVAGGKRCEYADAISNVRKKVRSKNKGKGVARHDLAREVSLEVRSFQEKNPALVRAHMPDKLGFHYSPPKKEVSEELKALLGDYSQPVKGVDGDAKAEFFLNMFNRNKEWQGKITQSEQDSLHNYTLSAFEYINPFFRRHGFTSYMKEHAYMWEHRGREEFIKRLRDQATDLDNALTKTSKPETPDKLYRFYRVPAGVSPAVFIKKYFPKGGGFKDRGFLSASTDPEYIAAHIMDRSSGKKNKGYVVLEMLSDRGGSLQMREEPDPGWVQSLESEILLPRNTGFQIVDTGKKDFVFNKHREDLEQRFSMFNSRGALDFSEGNGLSLPVVRMVDTKLIK